jgi:hypothetical protein
VSSPHAEGRWAELVQRSCRGARPWRWPDRMAKRPGLQRWRRPLPDPASVRRGAPDLTVMRLSPGRPGPPAGWVRRTATGQRWGLGRAPGWVRRAASYRSASGGLPAASYQSAGGGLPAGECRLAGRCWPAGRDWAAGRGRAGGWGLMALAGLSAGLGWPGWAVWPGWAAWFGWAGRLGVSPRAGRRPAPCLADRLVGGRVRRPLTRSRWRAWGREFGGFGPVPGVEGRCLRGQQVRRFWGVARKRPGWGRRRLGGGA